MTYTFKTTDDHKVIVEKDGSKIDEVGPFDTTDSATYWATEMDKKYSANPTYVYPGENPVEETRSN